MNEEEKKLLKIYKAQVEKEENEYFSVNAYTQLLYDSHKTVLNLITKLQKENEEKDKYIKHSEEITTEINNDINKLLLEIKEKDKQIDELVRYIDESNYVNSEICQFQHDFKTIKCIGNESCKDCIKRNFKKIAKEKGK